VSDGYLTRTGDARRIYSPTMRLVALAAQMLDRFDVARRAQPHVALLQERPGATAHLVVPSYMPVVCLCHAGGVAASPPLASPRCAGRKPPT
jgi:DNA-binding IclR family transcriptional regulator